MNYESYNQTFWQMQKDYFHMDDLITKIRSEKAQEYLSQNIQKEEYKTYAEEYKVLKSRIYNTATSLKEYFVKNNENFDYLHFGSSLSFFNGYSIMENEDLLKKSDYEKLNSLFLKHYKQELNRILISKKEQYEMLNNDAKADAKQYAEEFKEPIENSNNSTTRAKSLRARFEKDVIQRDNVYKKVRFIEKSLQTIDEVLSQAQVITK